TKFPPFQFVLLLNCPSGLHGALQTRAPRACAICMMLFSQVVPPGTMRLRSIESPMPLYAKLDFPSTVAQVPLLVLKNMSASSLVHVERQAEDAPNPSILW